MFFDEVYGWIAESSFTAAIGVVVCLCISHGMYGNIFQPLSNAAWFMKCVFKKAKRHGQQ